MIRFALILCLLSPPALAQEPLGGPLEAIWR